MQERTFFCHDGNMCDIRVSAAQTAVAAYEYQLWACRVAVNTWTIVGMRNNVVKDIRVLIGKIIWDARGEARYQL
jgi:hypothetical protein